MLAFHYARYVRPGMEPTCTLSPILPITLATCTRTCLNSARQTIYDTFPGLIQSLSEEICDGFSPPTHEASVFGKDVAFRKITLESLFHFAEMVILRNFPDSWRSKRNIDIYVDAMKKYRYLCLYDEEMSIFISITRRNIGIYIDYMKKYRHSYRFHRETSIFMSLPWKISMFMSMPWWMSIYCHLIISILGFRYICIKQCCQCQKIYVCYDVCFLCRWQHCFTSKLKYRYKLKFFKIRGRSNVSYENNHTRVGSTFIPHFRGEKVSIAAIIWLSHRRDLSRAISFYGAGYLFIV